MSFHKKHILPILTVWLISVAVATVLRLQPLFTYRSSDASEKATLYVLDNVKKKVVESINKNFPDLPTHEKNKLIKRNVDAIIRAQGPMVRKTIDHVSKRIDTNSGHAFQYPYLLASDSFYYYSLTERVLKTGSISDTIKGSKYLNKQMLAPEGHWEPLNIHPYVGALIYRIMKFFNKDIPLIFSLSFTPIILVAIAVIPFIFICRLRNISWLITFVSTVFFVSAPSFLKRSAFGWYDNDPYNTLFPLLIVLSTFLGLRMIQNVKKTIPVIGWAVITAVLISIYSLFWQGWMLLLTVVVGAGVVMGLYNHFFLKDPAATKHLSIYFGTILGGVLLGISVIFGPKEFFILFQEGWVALKNFLSPQLSLWPDLYLSVGELRKPTLPVIIHFVGGTPFFIIAVLGLIVETIQSIKSKDPNRSHQVILLGTLAVSTFILTLGAQRFILFLLIPFSLLFPSGLQYLFHIIDQYILKRLPKAIYAHKLSFLAVWIIILISLIPLIKYKYSILPKVLNKIYNATWEKALLQIREKTPEEAIINAWWPPGHFIKAVAKRRVTFDGATINKPQGYWLANVFLSRNEFEALGMLRMLNNSANQATEYLTNNGIKLSKAVKALKTIGALNKDQASRYLAQSLNFDSRQVEELLKLTHVDPPPSYMLIFNESVKKNMQFKFIGGWNFEKIEEINAHPGRLKALPNRRSSRYIQFLWDIAGGPDKYSDILGLLSKTGGILSFERNVKINLATKEVQVNSSIYGQGVPQSIFYLQADKIVEKKFANANLPYSVILFKNRKEYKCVLLDRPLAESLLMQLYFFNAKGLKYFKPFIKETDLTQRTEILIFEIDWPQFLNDLSNRKIIYSL